MSRIVLVDGHAVIRAGFAQRLLQINATRL